MSNKLVRPFAAACLLLCLTLATPAQGSHIGPQKGRALATVGIGIQGIGLGLAVASIVDLDNAFGFRIGYELLSPAFAPMTIAGFEAALSDSTEAGQFRAAGIGFLESALYAGVMAGVSAINLAVNNAYLHYQCNVLGHHDYCFEDWGSMYITVRLIAYSGVALAMLIPGVDLTLRAREATNQPGSANSSDHSVTLHLGPGGLQFCGRF